MHVLIVIQLTLGTVKTGRNLCILILEKDHFVMCRRALLWQRNGWIWKNSVTCQIAEWFWCWTRHSRPQFHFPCSQSLFECEPGQVIRTHLPPLSSSVFFWYQYKQGGKQAHHATYVLADVDHVALAGVWLRAEESGDQRCCMSNWPLVEDYFCFTLLYPDHSGPFSLAIPIPQLLLLLLQKYWFKWHIARYMLLGQFTKLQKYNVPIDNVRLANDSWNK